MKPQNCKNITLTKEETAQIQSWVPKHHRFGEWQHCFYCGEPAGSIDHVIPVSMLKVDEKHAGSSPGLKTMACMECNQILTNFFFPTLSERCHYLNGRLRRRYSNLLHLEIWQDWELQDMRGSLRDYVLMKQSERSVAVRRVSWQSSQKFTEMFEKAYSDCVKDRPENRHLHEFMKPPWMWS